MKHLYLFLFLILSSQLLLGQEGDIPLNHYKIPIPTQDYKFNDLRMDQQGRLLVAYKKGIMQFDGNSWLKIEISSSPIKFIEIGETIFILAKDGIYEMKEDLFHQNILNRLHSISITSTVVDLLYHGRKYYLLANDRIIVFNEEFEKLKSYESDRGYKDVFTFEEKLYAFEGNYLLENIDGTWVDLNLFAPENTDFVFSLRGSGKLYFAYDNGDFYSFDGQDFEPYSAELNEYLKENYPLSGKYISQKLIISTLSGGVILVEEKSGAIASTIQNYNGLPTDEVTALTMDLQYGLWLAHPYGLSRASLNIPLSDFQFYPGLEGFPEVTLMNNDTLWVGTTQGLFYLKQVKDYEVLQKKKLVKRVRIQSNDQVSNEEEEQSDNFLENIFSFGPDDPKEIFIDEELKKYRNIYRKDGFRFRALRDKLEEKEKQLRDSIQKTKKGRSAKNNSGSDSDYRSIVRTIDISKLKSIDFEYQKINEVDGHVEALLMRDSGIIARSNTGLFLVNGKKVTKISDLKLIKNVYYQPKTNNLWISNEQGLYGINLSKEYKTTKISENTFHDLLVNDQHLIAVGDNTLEVFSLRDSDFKRVQKMSITNNFSEKMALFIQDNKVKLLRSDAILALDFASSELKIDSVFETPLKYFLKDERENVWLLSAQDEWSTIGSKLSPQTKKWLHIIPPVKNIDFINDSTIFFTTNERIIRWNPNSLEAYPLPKTFIDGVIVENQLINDEDFAELNYGQNNLKVILSTPEYLFKEDVEYQYYVKGLMDEWSSWSKSREIDFPYIPTGEYKLQIKARTVFGNEVSEFAFNFEVLPPYWQTWWFYSLEIAFFSILILISIRLNTSNQSSYLTKTFTFLTLILFLEFIATVLENNLEGYIDESPVYTFIINVVLALSISPIEKGISKLLVIFNSSKSKALISEMRKNQIEKRNEQSKN